MKCCICNSEIEKQQSSDGRVFWDKGHNPAPVMTGEDDRCCGDCNCAIIIPARLTEMGFPQFQSARK